MLRTPALGGTGGSPVRSDGPPERLSRSEPSCDFAKATRVLLACARARSAVGEPPTATGEPPVPPRNQARAAARSIPGSALILSAGLRVPRKRTSKPPATSQSVSSVAALLYKGFREGRTPSDALFPSARLGLNGRLARSFRRLAGTPLAQRAFEPFSALAVRPLIPWLAIQRLDFRQRQCA